MSKKIIVLLLVLLSKSQCSFNNASDVWKTPNLKLRFNKKIELDPLIINSIRQMAHETLYRILQSDRMKLINGIYIIKCKNAFNSGEYFSIDRNTQKNSLRNATNAEVFDSEILNMMLNGAERYSLRVYLNHFLEKEKVVYEGRHRRRRHHHMMPFMVFGIVGLSVILIPMGFKFLTILGGKALLLAKMALILSSIQGLKKFATSSYNYGLYQTSPAHPWHYDRHGYEEVLDTNAELLPHGYIPT